MGGGGGGGMGIGLSVLMGMDSREEREGLAGRLAAAEGGGRETEGSEVALVRVKA